MLEAIAKTDTADYDLLVSTRLDCSVELGDGRDTNEGFRLTAAEEISRLVADYAPHALLMTSGNGREVACAAIAVVKAAVTRLHEDTI